MISGKQLSLSCVVFQLIAGLGGVFKDGYGAGEVVAPIFQYRNFEQLEHEGRQQFGAKLQRVEKAVARKGRS